MKPRGTKELHSNSYTGGVKEEMHWIPIEELDQYVAYPAFLKERLGCFKEGIEHIDYKSSKEALEAKRKYETDKKTVNTKKNVKAYGTAKQGVKSDKSTMGNFDKRTSGGSSVKFGKNGRTNGKTPTASKNGKAKGFSPEKKNGVTVYKNGKRYGNKK